MRFLQGVVAAAELVLVSALPAAAQSLGAGISFLGNEGGVGIVVDYSKPFQKQSGKNTLGWVFDFGYNHKSEGNSLANASFTNVTVQGGVRIAGEAGDKLTWDGQGLVGLHRSSGSVNFVGTNLCTGCSNTGAMISVGGGLQYALSDSLGLRGQLDIPIFLGDGGGNTTRFAILAVFKR